ncbi:MAG: hypothetical protein RLZZ621_2148 [Gemmatimonadota bacterium]
MSRGSVTRTICSAVIGSVLVAPTAAAQSSTPTSWQTRHQDAVWVGGTIDRPITKKTALWFDGSWRRMAFGREPQQLLLRPGVQYTVTNGVRLAAGYVYVATAPYGSLPAANPTREHRSWQQLLLTHRAGRVAFTQRYRLEQRWLFPLVPGVAGSADREYGDATYQNRLRYMGRGQTELSQVKVQGRPVLLYGWNELLMPLGGPTQTLTIGQNRASVGFGIPHSPKFRTEIGYMNLYNAFPSRRANEVNHTLWVSWHYTGAAK